MALMTKEESYAERRLLFKNIWETAMQIDDKDPDIMNKPKVIKTLRLDDDDKSVLLRRKKQRIRNLRAVCKKILDYCDRQDADEIQSNGEHEVPYDKIDLKPKKLKLLHRRKRKIRKTKSTVATVDGANVNESKPSNSLTKDSNKFGRNHTGSSKHGFQMRQNRTTVFRTALVTHFQPSSNAVGRENILPPKEANICRQTVRKKRSRRKCISQPVYLSSPSTGSPKNRSPALKGRAALRRVRDLLTTHKVIVNINDNH